MSHLPADIPLSAAAGRLASSAIRDLLAITDRDDIISLAGGMPASETFPTTELADAFASVLRNAPVGGLQYSATEGFGPLRDWVARNVSGATDRVLITSGSQQALDLVVRTMVDPGADVVLADPGYVGAIQVLRLVGANLVGVASDDEGMLVDDLASRLSRGLRPSLVYVIPNFHNPTGATLTPERCRALADLADRYGFVIVEDDPYRHLRWAGQAPQPLAATTDRVISLGSFSKILCPGLRVGYAMGPPAPIRAMTLAKQAADLHTSTLSQQAIHRVLNQPGFFEPHLDRIRGLYKEKASALVAGLHTHTGGLIEIRDPEGGMFVWGRLTGDGPDAEELLAPAIDLGVAFVPGTAFTVGLPLRRHLRLSFATASIDELDIGVQRLSRALATSEQPEQRMAHVSSTTPSLSGPMA